MTTQGLQPARMGVGDVARLMRETLAETRFPGENHRKAALRRILHGAVAGLEDSEAREFIEAVRSRFPDRLFEAGSRAHEAEEKLKLMEREQARIKAERDELKRRGSVSEALLGRIYRLVTGPVAAPGSMSASSAPGVNVSGTIGGSSSGNMSAAGLPVDPITLQPLFEALAVMITAAEEQEKAMTELDRVIARSGRASTGSLSEMLKTLTALAPGASGGETMTEIRRRLKKGAMQAAAVMSGSEQSWKSGTTRILEALDPKYVEKDVPGKIPGLRDAAILKEVRQRFEQFWGELDKNIAHYYRDTFETIYNKKMEDRP